MAKVKPYTAAQLKRGTCEVKGCKEQARYQWNCCADGNTWRMMCSAHDLELNVMFMQWAKIPGWIGKLKKYRKRVKDERWSVPPQPEGE